MIVYLSYDGALDPLGRSQIVPLLERLGAKGRRIHLVTFEKRDRLSDETSRAAMKERLLAAGVAWTALRYHKRWSIVSTLWDLTRALIVVLGIVVAHRSAVLHARSYPPALIAWIALKVLGTPFIFDIRGLYADERVDGGIWSRNSQRYRGVKYLERCFFRDAAAVITLTRASVPEIRQIQLNGGGGPEPVVVPTLVDVERFHRTAPLTPGRCLAYVGSLGTWYPVDALIAFGRAWLESVPGSRLLFLVNPSADGHCPRELLAASIDRYDLEIDRVSIASVIHESVPEALAEVTATVALIQPFYSKIASCPTKVGESLALGIPVAVNRGIGDAAEVVESSRTGVVVDPLEESSFPRAARALAALAEDPDIARRCRTIAVEQNSLESAVTAYEQVYESVDGKRNPRRIVVICPFSQDQAPGQRLKFEQYYSSWREEGWAVDVRPFWSMEAWSTLYSSGNWVSKLGHFGAGCLRRLRDLAAAWRADVVYLFLEAMPMGPPIFESIVRRSAGAMVYDIDDLVYLPHSSSHNPFMRWLRSRGKYRTLAGLADQVIVCTQQLEDFARDVNDNVTNISSTIDTSTYLPRPVRASTRDVVVGWSGSHSTSPYLHLLDDVLRDVQLSHSIRVKVIGDGSFSIPGLKVSAQEWNLDTEVEDLAEIDIGLYPLPMEEWVLGKSGLKALQYMALGIPTIAQRIGSNLEIIQDGKNGFLASTPGEWRSHLIRLVEDPMLRERIGNTARTTVEERYSVMINAPRYLTVLSEAFEASRRQRSSPMRLGR